MPARRRRPARRARRRRRVGGGRGRRRARPGDRRRRGRRARRPAPARPRAGRRRPRAPAGGHAARAGGLARALPRSVAARGRRCARTGRAGRGGRARAPVALRRRGAAALLRAAARLRARLAPPPLRRRRPRVRRRGQQRRRRRPLPPGRRGGRRARAPAAEHELALPLRRDVGVRRAPERAAPGRSSTACSSSTPGARRSTSRCGWRARSPAGATSSPSKAPTTAGRPPPTSSAPARSTGRTGATRCPPHVHIAEQPDPYRGRHGDDGPAYAESVAQACRAAEPHGGVAAFLAEPLLGNQGGVVPAPGWLAAAYAITRAAGGVCIADEVQVGYGRTGDDFWAFAPEGVVPDIVCVAKATGNGHPSAPSSAAARSRTRSTRRAVLLLHRRRARLVRDRPRGARRDRGRGPAGERARRRRAAPGGAGGARRRAPE